MIRALPKPLPDYSIKRREQRLPKGKAVSVGVAFRCTTGIVLCSDTQITWKDQHKAYDTKQFYLAGIHWTMASVYAGDPQLWKSFRDKFYELIEAFSTSHSREPETTKELRDILETALCYFNELDSDPMALCLLMGFVIENKEIKLVKSEGKLVSDVNVFDCVGCGDSSVLRYFAPFTADITQYEWPTISQALYTGTYWVLQAKRWIDGCGGDTEAFVLYWKGTMHKRDKSDICEWEHRLSTLEMDVSSIWKMLGDGKKTDEEFENSIAALGKRLREERARCLREL